MALILEIIDKSFHSDLENNDECYYLRDYTRGTGFQGSPTNDLILNFKKGVKYKGTVQYPYKIKAIDQISNEILEGFKAHLKIPNPIFCPIPPSKAKDHPEYDDRLIQVLTKVQTEFPMQILELIETSTSHVPQHNAEVRMSLLELKDHLQFMNKGIDLNGKAVFLFDDIITNGRHFKACKQLILEHYPQARVIGLFIARRIEDPNLENWDPLNLN
jgi:phosphoribosylpyrophosphate synthetase